MITFPDWRKAGHAMRQARRDGFAHNFTAIPEWGATEHVWLLGDHEVRIKIRPDGYATASVDRPGLHSESSGVSAARILDILVALGLLPSEHSRVFWRGQLAGRTDLARELTDIKQTYEIVEQTGLEIGQAVMGR